MFGYCEFGGFEISRIAVIIVAIFKSQIFEQDDGFEF